MRFLMASFMMCFGVAGFCQETTPEAPAPEVTTTEEGGNSEVAITTESLKAFCDFGCGCTDNKPKK